MSTPPSNAAKGWQTLYTEKHARRDSLTRAGQLIVPIVIGLVPPLLFLILYTGKLVEKAVTDKDVYVQATQGVALILAVFLLAALGLSHLFKTAAGFLEKFHDLSAADNIPRLVRLRVLGIPPLPPPLFNLIKFPEITVKNEKLDPPNHWSTIVGGPVKLIISAGHALYLERGNYFSRVVGQGSAFLGLHERIGAVVNVGPRNEEITVTAWTKEGIKVTIKAKGEYFLGHTRTEDEENVLIPYDPEAIRKAVEHTLKSGKEAHEWLKSATGQTMGTLSAHISNHFLDDLFLNDNSSFSLLSRTIMSDLLNKINTRLQEYGVVLSNFQIFDVVLPEKVKDQRFETWKTSHRNFSVITEGEVKAYQIRIRERARAETQRDLIFTLANGLDRIDSTNFPEPLLLSISALLDQSMKDPLVRANLAKESLETLEKMQEAIKFPLQLPGEYR